MPTRNGWAYEFGGGALPPQYVQAEIDKKFPEVIDFVKKYDNVIVYQNKSFVEINGQTEDRQYFSDYGHMNQLGREIYTNWLADRILENPKLTDLFQKRK